MWSFVRPRLPRPPARVIEIGCGSRGGLVPELRRAGYDADGVDPEAPGGPGYHRMVFERYEPRRPVDAIVACHSLHHVTDLGEVVDRAVDALVPGGALIVLEFAWERFDEATVRWCLAHLGPPDAEPGWLHRIGAEWAAGESWEAYRRSWVTREGMHPGHEILAALDQRFVPRFSGDAPYLVGAGAEEQAAIDAGHIRATGIRYAGVRPRVPVAEPYRSGGSLSWPQGRRRLADGDTYWLATSGRGGRPHVVPVLAVWLGDRLYFSAGAATVKARNIGRDPRCTMAVEHDGMHLLVEGDAAATADETILRRIADRYADKYDWPVRVRDGALHADHGAPTAGPSPYRVFGIRPAVVLGLGTDGPHDPTRWRFPRANEYARESQSDKSAARMT